MERAHPHRWFLTTMSLHTMSVILWSAMEAREAASVNVRVPKKIRTEISTVIFSAESDTGIS
jgi:hypothetical protein